MSSHIPSAPSVGVEPKKNTALTVVVVLLVVFIVVPLVIGAILVFAVLRFLDNHYDEIDINGIIHGIEYVEENGLPLTHNESTAVRNIISTIEDKTSEEHKISRRDCLYMQRISENYSAKWIDSYTESEISFCDNEYIYGSVTFDVDTKESDTVKYNGNGHYDLRLTSDFVTCANFTFSGFLNSHDGYKASTDLCNESGMVKLEIIDTGEQLEPKTILREHTDNKDDGEDDEDSKIKIKINA